MSIVNSTDDFVLSGHQILQTVYFKENETIAALGNEGKTVILLKRSSNSIVEIPHENGLDKDGILVKMSDRHLCVGGTEGIKIVNVNTGKSHFQGLAPRLSSDRYFHHLTRVDDNRLIAVYDDAYDGDGLIMITLKNSNKDLPEIDAEKTLTVRGRFEKPIHTSMPAPNLFYTCHYVRRTRKYSYEKKILYFKVESESRNIDWMKYINIPKSLQDEQEILGCFYDKGDVLVWGKPVEEDYFSFTRSPIHSEDGTIKEIKKFVWNRKYGPIRAFMSHCFVGNLYCIVGGIFYGEDRNPVFFGLPAPGSVRLCVKIIGLKNKDYESDAIRLKGDGYATHVEVMEFEKNKVKLILTIQGEDKGIKVVEIVDLPDEFRSDEINQKKDVLERFEYVVEKGDDFKAQNFRVSLFNGISVFGLKSLFL